MSENWSKDELKASVEAYVDMLRKLHAGQDVVKKQYYEDLANRFGRTAKAFEYRMQNISYVYSVMGRGWLPGLKPAKHVGTNVAEQIEEIIAEVEGRQFAPVARFETQVKELQQKPIEKPQGNKKPATTTFSATQFARDPAVKAWILQNAKGVCESCNKDAPFVGTDGLPFLEVHHVRTLANGGSDTVENAVALCPNCHRELHYGENAAQRIEAIYANVSRLVKE